MQQNTKIYTLIKNWFIKIRLIFHHTIIIFFQKMSTTRNPENPFVKDEFYFTNAIAYSETTLSLIHKISNISAFLIGMSLVCVLLFLIFFKTPSHFRPYSKMVFLCALTDSIILISDFLCMIVSFCGFIRWGKIWYFLTEC